jgi:hypothetical protein
LSSRFVAVTTPHTSGLGYYQTEQYMQILGIFHDNSSMLIAETPDHNGARYQELDCHILTSNTTSELGLPFSISPVNQNLIFYNCAEPQSLGRGLVETKCPGNMYVRVGPERTMSLEAVSWRAATLSSSRCLEGQ